MANADDKESGALHSRHNPTPFADAFDALSKRIKDEPFIFVLCIGVLLVGLVSLAGKTAPLNVIVPVFAGLCLVAMVGYYSNAIIQHRDISSKGIRLLGRRNLLALMSTKKSQRFWQPFIERDCRIILGRSTQFSNIEPTGFVGVGDAIAMTELTSFLNQIGSDFMEVAYADRLDGDALSSNLIVLGGPDMNEVAADVVKRLEGTLKIGQNEIGDTVSGVTYRPRRHEESSQLATDYGVVVVAPNPYAPEKRLLMVFGALGFGSWAGVRFLLSKEFQEANEHLKGDFVECLVEAEIVKGAPQHPKKIVMRPIYPQDQKGT